ncbi:MAG TPA: hypothetical protein VNO26_06055 [Candidatus Limnocylindria bacterium]|nr:hypothetical protein [Candidatus Limnocylindria bacterium]
MRGRSGWLAAMVMAAAIGATTACATDAPRPAPPAAAPAPGDEQCRAVCQELINRCTSVFGPAMGDMRPYCERAVLRRCRDSGPASCEAVAREKR